MASKLNLINQKFSRLLVIRLSNQKNNKDRLWECKCECGNSVLVSTYCLTSGNTKSCGCLKKEFCINNFKNRVIFDAKFNAKKRKYNDFIFCDDIVKIATKSGNIIVDKADYNIIKNYYWSIVHGYPTTQVKTNDCKTGHRKTFKLHQIILGKQKEGLEVDHINRNKLDNRRCNLRVVTHLENMNNIGKPITNTSGFKNVSYDKTKKKFVAGLTYHYKHYYLGAFNSADEANFAVINFRKNKIKGE